MAELPPTVQALAALVRELGPELRVKTHRTAKVVTCTVSSPEDVLVLRQHGAGAKRGEPGDGLFASASFPRLHVQPFHFSPLGLRASCAPRRPGDGFAIAIV